MCQPHLARVCHPSSDMTRAYKIYLISNTKTVECGSTQFSKESNNVNEKMVIRNQRLHTSAEITLADLGLWQFTRIKIYLGNITLLSAKYAISQTMQRLTEASSIIWFVQWPAAVVDVPDLGHRNGQGQVFVYVFQQRVPAMGSRTEQKTIITQKWMWTGSVTLPWQTPVGMTLLWGDWCVTKHWAAFW